MLSGAQKPSRKTMDEKVLTPTHVQVKPDGGRHKNTTVRSYLMELPSKRMVEALRIYSFLLDDIAGLDWKHAGGPDLPEKEQPMARARMAKDRAAVARVALESLNFMADQAKLIPDEEKKYHIVPGHIQEEENMTLPEIRNLLDKSHEKLKGLQQKEQELMLQGE